MTREKTAKRERDRKSTRLNSSHPTSATPCRGRTLSSGGPRPTRHAPLHTWVPRGRPRPGPTAAPDDVAGPPPHHSYSQQHRKHNPQKGEPPKYTPTTLTHDR